MVIATTIMSFYVKNALFFHLSLTVSFFHIFVTLFMLLLVILFYYASLVLSFIALFLHY